MPSFSNPKLILDWAFALLVCVISPVRASESAGDQPRAGSKPNIVWIMAEDCSVDYFRLYRAGGAPTPNLEALAARGLTFDHAYSCAPVCSVARTTLLTGCYAPRLATQFHRASRKARLPDHFKVFPTRLRESGYYTTNRSKEDYNCIVKDQIWDESSRNASWKNRPTANTPFFHVETITTTHESSLHFDRDLMDRSSLPLTDIVVPPYLPDTPLTRFTKAHYLKQIETLDTQIGKIIDQLRKDDVMDQTVIFFFGDHGGVLPRSKGYLFDSGLHVPLVVWVPKSYQHLSPFHPGSRIGATVEFIDFGNTVLRLAGLREIEQYDGQAFLGENLDSAELEKRDTSFAYADRFDEKSEMVRSLKVGKWKYIRSFEPFSSDSLNNDYRFKMLAYQQWRTQHSRAELNATQNAFFNAKPIEQLYDLQSDPHEIHNLASEPAHQATLLSLRQQLIERLKALPDLSFFPECYLTDHAVDHPMAFAEQHREQITKLLAIADLGLQSNDNEPSLLTALNSDDVWIRYHAAIVCASKSRLSPLELKSLDQLSSDNEPVVAARAAQALVLAGQPFSNSTFALAISKTQNEAALLEILNCLAQLSEQAPTAVHVDANALRTALKVKPTVDIEHRLKYLDHADAHP